MLNFEGKQIYLACGSTDMRRSIDGLAIIVQESFKLDLFDKAIFVFCNRNRDCLKILEWDNDGFWLYYKRLEKGRFVWPGSGETQTMSLTSEELTEMLRGVSVQLRLKKKNVIERNVS